MQRRSLARVVVALIIAVPGLAAAQGAAKVDPKLPAAIEAAFKKAYPKATIKHVEHARGMHRARSIIEREGDAACFIGSVTNGINKQVKAIPQP